MQQIPLPKLYWETFQDALQAQVKRLAKEIAGTLNQSEQPLLKALATEKVTAYANICRHLQKILQSSRGAIIQFF